MAFDFPAAPANGAVFTPPGGPTYVYNSAVPGWMVQADPGGISQADADLRYVNVPGDTMAGKLTINVTSDVPEALLSLVHTTSLAAKPGGLVFAGGNYGFLDYDAGSQNGIRLSGLGPVRIGSNTNAAYSANVFTDVLRVEATKVTVHPATASASKITGALVVTGGIGVSARSYMHDLFLSNPLYLWPPAGAAASMEFNSEIGQYNIIYSKKSNVMRWHMMMADNVAESGANAGSNFALARYSDAGTLLGSPLIINRATGAATVEAPITQAGAPYPMGTVVQIVHTASGTWTKRPGLRALEVEVCGGGGGSQALAACLAGQSAAAGGGGGGGYSRKIFPASALSASHTFTVAAGGPVNGTGGTSSFGGISGSGGIKGGAVSPSTAVGWAAGGTVGVGTGGELNVSGATGGPCVRATHGIASMALRGSGGGSFLYGVYQGLYVQGSQNHASPGMFPGGGSVGGAVGNAAPVTNGGAGGAGVVIFKEYY